MAQRLIPVLVFFVVLTLGSAVLVYRGWRRRSLEERLYGKDPVSGPFGGPGGMGGSGAGGVGAASGAMAYEQGSRFVTTVEQIGRAVSSGKPEAGLRQWLAQAGYYHDAAPTIYVGTQLILGLLALTLGGAAAFSFELSLMIRACIIIAVVAFFALLPNILVTIRKRRRTANVRSHLPDAIDLLEICVSSGMGLDTAWNAVCDEFRGVSPLFVGRAFRLEGQAMADGTLALWARGPDGELAMSATAAFD